MKPIFILIILSLILAACGNSGVQPIEATQTMVAVQQQQVELTQAALSLSPTQTALALIQAEQNAQIIREQTREAELSQATQTQVAILQTVEAGGAIPNNAAWTVTERDFDGVTMVLVPAGCFMMGSTQEHVDALIAAGVRSEFVNAHLPQHEQCVDAPFWIDKTEVTQGDFARLGGVQEYRSYFSGENRPVDTIIWFEARDFCALRGGRLPTEAEWEYAARGVDGWEYPWGDPWNENNVIWDRSESQGTANVGSIAAGASWVGALDMSGNVYEWTSSQYQSYPYDATDGREDDMGSRTDVSYVLRGGSWFDDYADVLRVALRFRGYPASADSDSGFRCVRAYE